MVRQPRVGILGGTFDPIHWGHLIIGEEARVRLGLDKVLFVPARNQWRKERHELTPPEQRLAMVQAGIADNPHFAVSRVDIDREGLTYTVDTLTDLAGEGELYFILGMDSLLDLPYWREPHRILELARLVAAIRPGYELDWSSLERAMPGARDRVILLPVPEIGISSTAIRERVARGIPVHYWVPAAVEEYIDQQGLYREP